MTDCEGTCDYVARKDDPSNWYGDSRFDWMLEQEVWTCPHDALDGAEQCVFHTDPEDVPEDVNESEQFIAAVNETSAVDDEETARRRKEFVGATFGSFDISGAVLDADDEYPISVDHARFARGVDAENAVFEHGMFARGARFETGDSDATGEGAVSFDWAEFGDGEVSFYRAEFGEGAVSFFNTSFGKGKVSFFNTSFGKGKVSFFNTSFGKGEVSFDGTSFGEGEVSFDGTSFSKGDVSFREAEFGGGKVSFSTTSFGEGDVSFYKAEFVEGAVSTLA